jgi:nucleotide-binding universal stress UspA family protein
LASNVNRTRKSTRKGPIICGTDFSVHAAEAAQVAAAMAKALREKLILTHVAETAGGEAPAHNIFAKLRSKLSQESERLREGASIEERVVAGSPAEVLREMAESTGAQCIVISSLGQIAPSQFLAGSVAERTAESSATPTLIVRKSEALMKWTRRKAALRVLVGCDFSPAADAAIRWALGLRAIGRCEIVAVHINRLPEESARLGATGSISLIENAPTVQRVLMRELTERVQSLGGDDKVRFLVSPSWGRIDPELLEIARRDQVNLIVVGTHQRHGLSQFWLGSVSRGVLRHAVTNVAVVPTETGAKPVEAIPLVRRVLVTTDFSEIGNRAIPHACSALPNGGTVSLLHVVEDGRDKSGRDAKQKLQQLIPAEAAGRGITATIEVVQSKDVPRAICQAAERFGADILCIASHGRTGLLRTLLGSVAQQVVAQSSRPILLVRARK